MSTLKHSSLAKDVFSYLLMIIMLYVGVISFVAMIWQYVNVGFPDELSYSYGSYDVIRNSISSLVIVWPVLLLVSWMIAKEVHADHAKKELRVRKWLLYLTLFIAAITIIADLISLLNSFLSGELTMRFVLKVLVILAVAASVFAFYLWDLKREPSDKTRVPLIVAVVSSLIILGSIIGGFFIVGSPAKQRLIRLDNERLSDVQVIQSEIVNYWMQKQKLPEKFEDLHDSISGFTVPVDPLTKESYGYDVKGNLNFELCATFALASDQTQIGRYKMMSVPYPAMEGKGDVWTHPAGRVCFDRDIDPELYRKVVK